MEKIYSEKCQSHKKYFREPTLGTIKRLDLTEIDSSYIERIVALEEGQGLVINGLGIPYNQSPRWFLKHGEVLEQTLGQGRNTSPLDRRRETMDNIAGPYLAGLSFRPRVPESREDNRLRRVSLVECLEGSRIYCYTHQVKMVRHIEIGEYIDSRAVAKDGATVPVRVPSRRQKIRRYHFDLTSVPIRNNREKFGIAARVATRGHDCKRKLWHIRYNNGVPSDEHVFCAHEVAGYRQVMDEMWAKGLRVPAEMSPFPQPTTLSIEFYKRLLDSVLIKKEDKVKKPNKAEEELLMWGLVFRRKHNPTFYRESGAGKLKEEDWTLRHI